MLDLSDNRLDGEIPSELGRLTDLVTLDLNRNQLIGKIPAGLGELGNLKNLTLVGNLLSGDIPIEIGALPSLERLYLAGNRLYGCIPDALRNVNANDFAHLSLSFCTPSVTPSEERLILESFYNATGGPGWGKQTNWLTDAPVEAWYGVATDSSGHVTELTLFFNEIEGVIPVGTRLSRISGSAEPLVE